MLRSISDLKRCTIGATDGDIGPVEDLVVDDEAWAIRYMLVDTKNWWPGKKVLVSPEWVDRLSHPDRLVTATVCREAIRNAPELEPSRRIDRDSETKLHEHHGRPGYWARPHESWRIWPVPRTS